MYIFNVNLETFIEVNLLNKTIKTSESYQTCRKADLTEHNGRSCGLFNVLCKVQYTESLVNADTAFSRY